MEGWTDLLYNVSDEGWWRARPSQLLRLKWRDPEPGRQPKDSSIWPQESQPKAPSFDDNGHLVLRTLNRKGPLGGENLEGTQMLNSF